LTQADIEVELLETHLRERDSRMLRALAATDADVVGFSCYIWNITLMEQLAHDLHTLRPELTIVFGGPEVSFDTERYEGESIPHYIVTGPGEQATVALCHALEQHMTGLPRVWVGTDKDSMRDEGILYSPEELPSGSIVYYESSRGCPYRCGYCLSGETLGVRMKSVEQTLADLDAFERLDGVRVIKFVDRTFNADPRRANALWRALRDERYTKTYHFEICAGLLNEDSFAALAALPRGKVQLEIGLQSTNEPTLAAASRHIDAAAVLAASRRLTEMGNIHVHLDLIAGLPYEGYDRFAQSFDEAYPCCHLLQLGFLKLLRGTPLRRDAEQYDIHYLEHPPYTVLQTQWLSYGDLCRLHDVDDVLSRYRDSGRFSHSLYLVLSQLPSPFRFYEALAAHIAQVYARPVDKLSQPDAFRALLDCATSLGVTRELLLPLLRLDFEACERRSAPHWMRSE
jgi:hypothetical protein